MTPTQRKFLAQIEETRELPSEVVAAINALAKEALSKDEFEALVRGLLKATERDDATFSVKGVIGG